MSEFRVRGVLLDIEGTVAPIDFVTRVLFPFARENLADFLAREWNAPSVAAARAQIARDANHAEFERGALIAHLNELMDGDVKATGLKELQGLIWAEGYASGALRSVLFADVPNVLRRWHAAGIDLRIYSSGSVGAQRLFFRHTEHGDLTPLLSGYYDTSVGKKQETASYVAISREFAQPPAEILFASDVTAELDAAAAAGLKTLLLVRPGNKPTPPGAHPTAQTLESVSITIGDRAPALR